MGISLPSPNHIASPKEPSAHFKQLSKETTWTTSKAESSRLVKLPGDLVICSLNRKPSFPSPNHIQSLKLWHAWVEKRSLRGLGQVKLPGEIVLPVGRPLATRWRPPWLSHILTDPLPLLILEQVTHLLSTCFSLTERIQLQFLLVHLLTFLKLHILTEKSTLC